jgi:hypothetical protein
MFAPQSDGLGLRLSRCGAGFGAKAFAIWRKFQGVRKSCHPERSEGSALSVDL